MTCDNLYVGKIILNVDDPLPNIAASVSAAPKLTEVVTNSHPVATSSSSEPAEPTPSKAAKVSQPVDKSETDTQQPTENNGTNSSRKELTPEVKSPPKRGMC